MVASSPRFPDIQNHWAGSFIEELAQQGIISGFPDGSFRPDQPMSRAQFAALLQKALPKPTKRPNVPFVDVPAQHWANAAIRKAYETGFMSGYPGNRFLPEASIARVEVLVSLVTGLEINSPALSEVRAALPELYQDFAQIPTYAIDRIALATEAGMVVNYPNLKLFRPLEAATRAEVAAFIYQALVYLGKMPAIGSQYVVIYQKTVKVSHQREFRGVWVATVWNIDWPSQRGLPVEQQQKELIQILDRLEALNFNALILQVRPTADALYASELEPWSEWLTGTQGKAPSPFYDPLEFAIAQCHKRNIELHTWFNPYRAKTSTQGSPSVYPHITVTHPEYVYQYGNQQWMDPGVKVIQDLTYNAILEVVRRYDIDGVQLDDYFYPYPIAEQAFPDQKTYQAYKTGGGTLSLGDWRRDNVNRLIQRLATGIRATKQHVRFGISPFGIYRPGQPPGIKGLDQYEALYADPKKWLQEGWVDYVAPQLYWRIDPPAQSYPVLLQWWTDNNPQRRHIYPGNRLSMLDGKDWPIVEYERQIDITRNLASKYSLGNIFYNMKVFNENRLGVVESLQSSTYNEPALAPSMTWLSAKPPATPARVRVSNAKITWTVPANTDIQSWTIYQQKGGSWKLYKILDGATTQLEVQPGTYAVCAVDRMVNESLGVVVSVS
ncbi:MULTISPECIES: glycoside hydrolase family 10 protein [unclassified Coleofasciculus]|uniref:glycoside hydrolase family 10 protein n=1 Tax=unclassified Coleofasciculus TaxID=2692782 RepID=UPI0018802D4A|nr:MULTISPECIES: family 10 glycosylhydrolase [unclassified Coleofasciculus]MBE9129304.1 family 10 glycosylhydrolase [Coleofasciculus sp. LEGE 07081]MBE9151944.1 family 10 glycosylhydrolase [Coleofasciculus sp. LEGE 07092]